MRAQSPRNTGDDSMRIGEAEQIAGTLSKPSKMPGYATSTSAFECKIGSLLRKVPGSVCEGCYATRANYQYPSVQVAHARRLAGLRHPRWVEAMVTLIQHRVSEADPYFRWHDSGDLQGEWHLANICEVARRTPNVRHWLPTREKALVKRYLRAGGVIPGNLTVRISAPMVDGPAPSVAGGLVSSTVVSQSSADGYACPARSQSNQCGTCRACWSREVQNVAYARH